MSATRESSEAMLARMLVEGAKLYIIAFEHRHGADVWPRISVERPSEDDEIAAIESWEGEDHGDYLTIHGPFELIHKEVWQKPEPVTRAYRNYYVCEACEHEWDMVWDSACNDKCEKCGREIEPLESELQNSN